MRRWVPLLPVLLMLGGCFQDTASYSFGKREHSLTLVRNQDFPWQSTVSVEVMMQYMPECNGGGSIPDVGENVPLVLYRAPDEYPEPLVLLQVDTRVFAVSVVSCRMQAFQTPPASLGEKLGEFKVDEGVFKFVRKPDDPAPVPDPEPVAAPATAPTTSQ